MRRRCTTAGLLAALLGAGLLATGCNSENAPPVKPLPSPDQMKRQNKAQGGGVDDMTVYPAPPGQKTGLEGGKK